VRPICQLAGVVLGLVSMMLLSGCSSGGFPTAPVRGTITYQGKPLTTGTILFRPEGDLPSATGEIKPDGSYVLTTYTDDDGAVLGKHDILITAIEDQTDKLPEARNPAPGLIIPVRYTNFATSGLSREVKEGQNTFDFELTN
jgi:hypothetical protein